MKIAGIVIAKQNSNRFPGKNVYQVDGKPLFYHAVEALAEMKRPVDVYVATDSDRIQAYCERRHIRVIWRGYNISHDDQPIFDVLKFVHQSIASHYDVIVMVLANTIGVKPEDIDKAVDILLKNKLMEVRSYDLTGVENGIVVLSSQAMLKHEISTYVGAIFTTAKEIHHESEITGC